MEIDLLRGLQHKNIVQYIEHLMVDSTLNIVMEFVSPSTLSFPSFTPLMMEPFLIPPSLDSWKTDPCTVC